MWWSSLYRTHLLDHDLASFFSFIYLYFSFNHLLWFMLRNLPDNETSLCPEKFFVSNSFMKVIYRRLANVQLTSHQKISDHNLWTRLYKITNQNNFARHYQIDREAFLKTFNKSKLIFTCCMNTSFASLVPNSTGAAHYTACSRQG